MVTGDKGPEWGQTTKTATIDQNKKIYPILVICIVTFYRVTVNTELVNTEKLLLAEVQG